MTNSLPDICCHESATGETIVTKVFCYLLFFEYHGVQKHLFRCTAVCHSVANFHHTQCCSTHILVFVSTLSPSHENSSLKCKDRNSGFLTFPLCTEIVQTRLTVITCIRVMVVIAKLWLYLPLHLPDWTAHLRFLSLLHISDL